MLQIDSKLKKTGTVFPAYPGIQERCDKHQVRCNQDNMYAIELEDVTAPVTRAREYRVHVNPFGQRALVKREFLYDTEKGEPVGEKYSFAPVVACREINVDTLGSIRWEPVSNGIYGRSQLFKFALRIAAVVLFLFLVSAVFNWFVQGEAGARFLYNQTIKSYRGMEYQEIPVTTNMAGQLTTDMMEREHFVIYDYANGVTVQKRGDILLFDMGEQGRFTYELASDEATNVPNKVLEYMPEQYFIQDTYLVQRVIHQESGDTYILEGEGVLLYYPKGAFVTMGDTIVKILFQEIAPIFE